MIWKTQPRMGSYCQGLSDYIKGGSGSQNQGSHTQLTLAGQDTQQPWMRRNPCSKCQMLLSPSAVQGVLEEDFHKPSPTSGQELSASIKHPVPRLMGASSPTCSTEKHPCSARSIPRRIRGEHVRALPRRLIHP